MSEALLYLHGSIMLKHLANWCRPWSSCLVSYSSTTHILVSRSRVNSTIVPQNGGSKSVVDPSEEVKQGSTRGKMKRKDILGHPDVSTVIGQLHLEDSGFHKSSNSFIIFEGDKYVMHTLKTVYSSFYNVKVSYFSSISLSVPPWSSCTIAPTFEVSKRTKQRVFPAFVCSCDHDISLIH